MKIEFLLFGLTTAFSDCKGPRKHFKIGKLATVQCSHETKSCDINCEFGVKVRDFSFKDRDSRDFRMVNHQTFNVPMGNGTFLRKQRFFAIKQQ